MRADIARPAWPRRLDLRRIVMHDFPLKAAASSSRCCSGSATRRTRATGRHRVVRRTRAGRGPSVPNGFVLRGNLGDVAVRLSGPEDAVSRIGLADLHATLNISGVDASRPEPHDAIVDVTVANDAVKVVEVSPATIAVRLEQITSRTVVVQAKLANDPPAGTQASAASVSPKKCAHRTGEPRARSPRCSRPCASAT